MTGSQCWSCLKPLWRNFPTWLLVLAWVLLSFLLDSEYMTFNGLLPFAIQSFTKLARQSVLFGFGIHHWWCFTWLEPSQGNLVSAFGSWFFVVKVSFQGRFQLCCCCLESYRFNKYDGNQAAIECVKMLILKVDESHKFVLPLWPFLWLDHKRYFIAVHKFMTRHKKVDKQFKSDFLQWFFSGAQTSCIVSLLHWKLREKSPSRIKPFQKNRICAINCGAKEI
jgi:hypothetical protein